MKAKENGAEFENSLTLKDIIDDVLNEILCGLLHLRRYDARKILRTCPGLITVKGSKKAYSILRLFSSLGVSYKSLARYEKASTLPYLLNRDPKLLFRLVAFLSSEDIYLELDSIGPLLRRVDSLALLDAVCPVSFDIESDLSMDDNLLLAEIDPSLCRLQRIEVQYKNMKEAASTL